MTALAPERIEERLRVGFPGAAIRRQTGEAVRDHTLYVPSEHLVEICTFLRDDPELDFAMLSWIAGVDWLPRDPQIIEKLRFVLGNELCDGFQLDDDLSIVVGRSLKCARQFFGGVRFGDADR